MFSKYTSKASKLLRDHTFSKAYLLIVLSLVGIYLTATAVVYQGNLIASYIVFFLVAVFIFTNTKKKLNAKQLDTGFMVHPFDGMPVMALLEGPHTDIQKSPETERVPVFLLNWLYFCVYAISKSNEEKFHYHQHLIETVEKRHPELLSWVPEMYKVLKCEPPIPKEISVEDFQ